MKKLISIVLVFIVGVVTGAIYCRSVFIDTLVKKPKESKDIGKKQNSQWCSGTFATREKAKEVLEKMIKISEDYDHVTVSDLNMLSDHVVTSYEDINRGWSNKSILEAFIQSNIDDNTSIIMFPNPEPLERRK